MHIALHLPDDDGSTLFARLQKARKDTGRVDARLLPKPLPLAAAHLWEWFWELDAGREETMNGLARISHRSIVDWAALTGNVVRDPEVQILLAMDRARRDASTPEAVEARRAQTEKPRKRHSLVQQLFDLKKSHDANPQG